MSKMMGAILPGNSTVELKEFDIPKPGHGQVLVQTKATTICGSDIRCIYREHVGKGPEGYIPGMIAGHEPCGIIVEEGDITFPVPASTGRLMAGRGTAEWHRIFWRKKKT